MLILSIFFWVIVLLTIIFFVALWNEPFIDGSDILGTLLASLLLWGMYFAISYVIPIESATNTVSDFQTVRTESGMHIIYDDYSEYTSDVYMIENIKDTSKVRVFIEENYNSYDDKITSSLKIKKK